MAHPADPKHPKHTVMGVFTDLPDAHSDETSPEFSSFPELCAKSPLTVLLFTVPALTALFQLQLFPVTKL